MQNKILQRCLDILNGEKPDLSYIRGMIETLLALGEEKSLVPNQPLKISATEAVSPTIVDTAMTEAEKIVANLRLGMNGKMTIMENPEVEVNTIQ